MAARRTQRRTLKKGPDWKDKFLQRLAATCNVSAACQFAKVPRRTAYDHKERDLGFSEAWNDAVDVAVEALELEARRRALQGTLRPIFQGGKKCGMVREFSDTLTIFLLKAHRPDKYRENSRIELTGKGGGPIQHEDTTDEQLDAEIASLEAQLQKPAPRKGSPAKPD